MTEERMKLLKLIEKPYFTQKDISCITGFSNTKVAQILREKNVPKVSGVYPVKVVIKAFNLTDFLNDLKNEEKEEETYQRQEQLKLEMFKIALANGTMNKTLIHELTNGE